MRWRCVFLGCVFVCVACFGLLQSGFIEGVKAEALSGGRFMTPTETRAIFGDTIPAKYFNGTDYVDVNFTYTGTATLSTCDWVDSSGYFTAGRDVICYFVNNVRNVNSNANYITVDCSPFYSLFDFDTLYTSIGISNAQSQNISAYQSPFWKWFINDREVMFEGSSAIPASGEFPHCVLSNSTRSYIFCPVEYHSQSLVSGYSLRAGFYGASHYNGAMFMYIACPYITDGATGQTGTFTTTSGGSGGDVNVNVDIDLEETNGILDSILDALGGFGDMLLGLFIPSQEFLEDWVEAMQQLLEDHLGGLYEAIDEIISSFSGFSSVTAKTSIHIDACNIPLAGQTLTLGNWDVPLKNNALPQIFYDSLAYIIDFLATAAFLNMCKRKIELFLNPDNEVITSAD